MHWSAEIEELATDLKNNTTGNHVVLFTYKQVNDWVTHTKMRMNLTLDFRVFSYVAFLLLTDR